MTAPASFISAGDKNKFILAFLCSKVGRYFIYKNSDTTGAGDIMLNIQSLVQFPIPLSPSVEINELCSKMLENPSNEIQGALDKLIYRVYRLNEEEIIEIERY